jgi:hypothetical protein
VYGLYYYGNFRYYQKISQNRTDFKTPIYVGKAVPEGWRSGRTRKTTNYSLYRRLREHANSISHVSNIALTDFKCRFILLIEDESDLVIPVEAELIRQYRPIWNSLIDGFGNHDPGSGRYNQAKSEWDVLHPGREWANRLTGQSPKIENIISKLNTLA